MPLKIYQPNGEVHTWEDGMMKADHQHERITIDDKMKQIFPRLASEPDPTPIKYYPESEMNFDEIHKRFPADCCAALKGGRYCPDHSDIVKSPDHYAYGGIETIDYIKAKLTPDEFCGYCWGNVLKYISRFNKKDGVKDLCKAKVYLDWLVEAYEKRLVFPHKVVE